MDTTLLGQLREIQEWAIKRSNTLAMLHSISLMQLASLTADEIIKQTQEALLLNSVYDGLLATIDAMIGGQTQAQKYSIAALLSYVVGQFIIIRAFALQEKGDANALSDIEEELNALINYLTGFTGRDVLPTFV